MVKKLLGGIFIVIALVSVWYIYSRTQKSATPAHVTAIVKQGELKIAFSIDGKTAIERRDLKFTVSGKVSHIAVVEGQTVKRGQYLMALNTADVQKNLDKDLKDYLITRNTFEQTNRVTYPQGALTDTIKRALENTQYSLDKSVLDVEIRNIALKESYLYAPIDGTVSAINIKEGEAVNTQNSSAVVTITKPDSLSFEAYAEDVDALKITKEQKTMVMLDAIATVQFPSKVDFISNLATVDQNGLSTYKVKATITDPKGYTILDGMSGTIQFISKEKSGILIIPNSAVVRKNTTSYATKLENGIEQDVVIETGFTDGKEVEVISGLQKGDEVIIP